MATSRGGVLDLDLALAALAVLAGAGCHHTYHPTHVEPGWRTEVAAGAVHVTPSREGEGAASEPGTGYDVELALGHGSRSGDVGVLAEVMFAAENYFFDATPGEHPMLPSFGLFVQADLVPRHVAVGVGGVLGLRSAGYAQAGVAFDVGRTTLSIDAGGGIDVGRVVDGYGLVTAGVGGLDVGAWVDVMRYPDDVHEGDDPTDRTYAARRVAGGLVVRGYVTRPRGR